MARSGEQIGPQKGQIGAVEKRSELPYGRLSAGRQAWAKID